LNWIAQWIWDDGEARPRNHYLYFRRAFTLAEQPAFRATARVCADTRYKLYVNGSFVHHGPARSDPRHQTFEEYEIGPYLRAGENVIGALVTFYGVGTCYSLVGRGGFLLEAEVEQEGTPIRIVTDETWRTTPAPYRGGFERMSIQLPFPEVFDLRAEPVGWNASGFDDTGWQAATVIGPVGMDPWTSLEPRDIPLQRSRMILPAQLIQTNLTERPADGAGESLTPAEEMERATRLHPAPAGSVTWRHPGRFMTAPVSGAQGTSVVLDFGREVSGFVRLQFMQGAGGRVDVGYSERIEEDGSVNPNHFAGCPVHYADRLFLRSGAQEWVSFSPRAFRYLRLDFYDCPKPVEVQCELEQFTYPVEYRGEFQCSDPLLNRIWEVGRYTAELCMDDGYMDCPWRERGQWLADTRVEALVAAYAFGDTQLARRAWRQYAQSQGTTDGFGGDGPAPAHHAQDWLKCVYPSAPPFDTVLPPFNCIWLCGLWEYFLLSGDRGLLLELWTHVDRLLKLLERHESGSGLLQNLPGWVFVDWAKLDVRGEACHVNAFYYAGLLAAGKIARAVGMPERGGDLEMRAAEVKEAINDLLWDNARGLYADCLADGALSETVSEQANVLCMLYGIAERAQTEQILRAFYGDAGHPTTPAAQKAVRIATPYFSFYLLRALCSLGRREQALGYIRENWGRMLARGATTFWEHYEPQWSLCHAWSAAPTYDLPAEIAGIRPLQPGFEEFTVDLQPLGLTWLRARVPTVRGEIFLSYHYRSDQPFVDPMGGVIPLAHTEPAVTVNLTVPGGARAQASVPLAGIAHPTIAINGTRLIEKGVPIPGSGGDRLTLREDRLQFTAPAGQYHIAILR
jgi:hypothetical protein